MLASDPAGTPVAMSEANVTLAIPRFSTKNEEEPPHEKGSYTKKKKVSRLVIFLGLLQQ